MKKLLFISLLFIGFISHAQDHLGMWSFESVDREAIDTESMDKEKLEERIGKVSDMFGSLKLNFSDDGTYSLTVMGQIQSHEYVQNENILLLNKEDKLEVLTENKARFSSGSVVLFLQKGDVTVEKTYTYLKKTSYINEKIKEELLLGKWKVEEVRVVNKSEDADMFQKVGLMITLNFKTSNEVELGVSGFNNAQKFKINHDNNDLVGTSSSGEEKIVYRIHQLNDNFMIVSQIEDEILLYMVRDN